MDSTNLPPQVGELIEKGQQTVLNTTKTAVSDVSNTISDQVGLKNEANSSQATQNQSAPATEASGKASQEDLELTKEIVSDYYSPSQVQFNAQQAELEEQQRQAQLSQVRQKLALELHNEVYFNELRNAGAAKPQAQALEAEQMEETAKKDQMEHLQTSQKKQEDLAKFRAERRVEITGGIVG